MSHTRCPCHPPPALLSHTFAHPPPSAHFLMETTAQLSPHVRSVLLIYIFNKKGPLNTQGERFQGYSWELIGDSGVEMTIH